MEIFRKNSEISEDTVGELLEISAEIFEDFWILFGALIRAVSVGRAFRASRFSSPPPPKLKNSQK